MVRVLKKVFSGLNMGTHPFGNLDLQRRKKAGQMYCLVFGVDEEGHVTVQPTRGPHSKAKTNGE